MNLDDDLRQSLATAANTVNPGSPPVTDFVARAQRRRRARLLALTASAAALVVVVALVVAGSGEDPGLRVASGNATATSSVAGAGGGGDTTAVTTTTTAQPIGSSGTAYAPPASTVYPPPSTTTAAPRATTTTTEPNPGGDVVVTQADAGKTIALRQGQRLIVNLAGEGWEYTEPASDNDAVLHRVSGHADASGDATATFIGSSAGHATVTATKDAPCRKANPPCMTPSYLFQLTVNVI